MSMRMQVDILKLFEILDEHLKAIEGLLERVEKLEADRTLRLKPKDGDRGR